ncbi:hypothetical protein EZL74_01605 [Flavobacterium silvisoli]|uniref:Uncharacterized protein n=1 Tax=Flavobacterium silvisoli TaxID=2529433 RepID=A0A4Q9Z457_9FLAO|nr:hypothetical protein [Flavobacterium silvisoli]TBX71228.1 hypothetical protein EZL74_01605 [Flavobacterium silvisoli]
MRTKFLMIVFAVSSFLVSCKKEKEETVIENKNVNKFFSVELEAAASKADNFALYFSEDNTVDFKGTNAVWSGIKGGNQFETLTFALSEERIPTHIRLDFGLKADQDSVVVKNVKVSYYGNDYQFKGSDFFQYFIQDKQFSTKIDVAKGTITFLKKDGTYKTPYYYPTQATIDNIKKITTAK